MANYFRLLLRQSFARTWGWGDSLSGAAGSGIPIIAHYLPVWGKLASGSLWLVPIWGIAFAFLFRLFFAAPYELWKSEHQKARAANATLADIGCAKPLEFTHAEFRFDYDSLGKGPLTQIRLYHTNKSEYLLTYRLENTWIDFSGTRIALKPTGQIFYLQPKSSGYYDCVLSDSVEISQCPCPTNINFDYFYDTVPPTRERQTGATVRHIITASHRGAPVEGHWFDEQREA